MPAVLRDILFLIVQFFVLNLKRLISFVIASEKRCPNELHFYSLKFKLGPFDSKHLGNPQNIVKEIAPLSNDVFVDLLRNRLSQYSLLKLQAELILLRQLPFVKLYRLIHDFGLFQFGHFLRI